MNKKIQLPLIFLCTSITTIIITLIFLPKEPSVLSLVCLILFNNILFILIIRHCDIDKHLITKFFFLIAALFIPLIIDNDYFYSSYIQSTPITFFSESILAFLSIILYPHTCIFYILYKLDIFEMVFIVIPCYIFLIYVITRKSC